MAAAMAGEGPPGSQPWALNTIKRDPHLQVMVAAGLYDSLNSCAGNNHLLPRIPVAKQGEMVTGQATFDTAGEYTLRVQANDQSGEGGAGFQCCWTNTYVKVTVRP